MSDLISRIGVRKEYEASPGSHIQKLSVNGKSPSSIEPQHHHSKYATSKCEPGPTGSPFCVLFSTTDPPLPSLLARLEPMYADGESNRGDIVPLIDRIYLTREDYQSKELSSSVENPIVAKAPVAMTPHISAIEYDAFVNVENTTLPSRKRSSEQLNEKLPVLSPKTSAQPSHFPPTAAPQESELPMSKHPHFTTSMPSDKLGTPPLPVPTGLNIQESGNHPQSPTTIISQIRDVLLPLIIQNAQVRPIHGTDNIPEKIRDKAKSILTDPTCESFVEKMQSIERQMRAHRIQRREKALRSITAAETPVNSDGITSAPPLAVVPLSNNFASSLPTPPVSALIPNVPKAPKAMRLQEFAHVSPQRTRGASLRPPSRKGKEKVNIHDPPSNDFPPQPQYHGDNNALRSQTFPQTDPDIQDPLFQIPGPSNVSIPIDSEPFELSAKGRAGGDTVNIYHPSRHHSPSVESKPLSSPPPGLFGTSSRHRLSRSPDPYRHKIHRSQRYGDRRGQSSHRSESPSHSPDRSNPRGPTFSYRGRERDHSAAFRDSSKVSVREDHHRRPSYTSNSRSRSRSRPQLSRSPERQKNDHLPNKARRRNSYGSESRSQSRHRSVSRSPKPVPSHIDDDPTTSDYRKRHTSLSFTRGNHSPHSFHRSRSRSGSRYRSRNSRSMLDHHEWQHPKNDVPYGPPRPSEIEKAISIQPIRQTKSLAQVMEPCRNVPGLWFIKMGEEGMRILECEIDIDHETSLKWNLTSKSLPEPESVLYVQPQQHSISLKLMCMPTQVIRTLYKNSDLSTATPEEVATKVLDLENEWPRKGTLIVAVNSHKAWGKTWLPIDLEPSGPALDLTTHICEGTNVVRFIQLADMAETVFVLCATGPAAQDPKEECFWDISKYLNMSPGPLKLHPAIVKVT